MLMSNWELNYAAFCTMLTQSINCGQLQCRLKLGSLIITNYDPDFFIKKKSDQAKLTGFVGAHCLLLLQS
jgi:hypothetical protein